MQQRKPQRRHSSRSRDVHAYARLPPNLRAKVRETSTMAKEYDTETGNKIINDYLILEEIGRGTYGKVKLAVDLRIDEFVVSKHRPVCVAAHPFSQVLVAYSLLIH